MDFKAGDVVVIHFDSEYYIDGDEWNPKHTLGLIRFTEAYDYVFVLWANGKENCYGQKDLVSIEDKESTVIEALRMIHGL